MELHLTATECHLPYGPHGVTCHPTQVKNVRALLIIPSMNVVVLDRRGHLQQIEHSPNSL